MISNPGTQRRLRIGVAGLGRAFSLMLPTFVADPRVELVAAFDVRAEARERFRSDFDGAVYDRFEDFAQDPSMEVAYIASPHQFHAAQAELLAQERKHLLVEKPMALSVKDCEVMVAAAASAGVWLIVGHCHSFDTPYLQARALIQSGDYGQVRMIQAINYTDFLYRPRRPEELRTEDGGGVIFSQAAHQIDVVRLLAGGRPTSVKAVTGAWDLNRPTEGAYSAILTFDNGSHASVVYNGYGHFDSDEWCGWIGELGNTKGPGSYGAARRRLKTIAGVGQESALKNAATYGGPDYKPFSPNDVGRLFNQHFGPVIVSCDGADIRPLPDALILYENERIERIELPMPSVPRYEVIDELYEAVVNASPPLHDGHWAKATLEVCLAMLESARTGRELELAST